MKTAPSAQIIEQARKVCLLGASDEELADFFKVSLPTLVQWAQVSKEFLTAITPTDEDFAAHLARRQLLRAKKNAARKQYMDTTPSARIRAATSARMWSALKGKSDGSLFSRLGYSVEELSAHLEAQFKDGMCWANYGKWHVDHKRPCALFDQQDPEEFAACWALSNLQPLWAVENIKKGAKYG